MGDHSLLRHKANARKNWVTLLFQIRICLPALDISSQNLDSYRSTNNTYWCWWELRNYISLKESQHVLIYDSIFTVSPFSNPYLANK